MTASSLDALERLASELVQARAAFAVLAWPTSMPSAEYDAYEAGRTRLNAAYNAYGQVVMDPERIAQLVADAARYHELRRLLFEDMEEVERLRCLSPSRMDAYLSVPKLRAARAPAGPGGENA